MAERPRELGDFKKARVNGGTDNHSVKDSHKCRKFEFLISQGSVATCLRLGG